MYDRRKRGYKCRVRNFVYSSLVIFQYVSNSNQVVSITTDLALFMQILLGLRLFSLMVQS